VHPAIVIVVLPSIEEIKAHADLALAICGSNYCTLLIRYGQGVGNFTMSYGQGFVASRIHVTGTVLWN
jgi:hypothetical protein